MENVDIQVRDITPYVEVKIVAGSITLDLGLYSRDDAIEFVSDLESAVDDIKRFMDL